MNFHAYGRYLDLAGDVRGTPVPEEQNSDYESGRVQIGSELWRLRTGRITPTKPGAFVAVWERDATGTTQPFRSDDVAAGLLVFVEEEDRFGVFRFTAAHLEVLGVTSSASKPGKRGFRVYPSWCADLNGPATRTQRAQSKAFSVLA